jgi:ATP/maltotriose-dependent transcriptional regulator MalT/DNA-binding SARP family transcriptional activator
MLNAHQYTPPQLPRIVHRRRLMHRLENDGRRVTLVIGQAAQGKSTLVADFLTTQSDPVAWIHLDPEKGGSAEFSNLLVHAIQYGLNEPLAWSDPLDTPKTTLNVELNLKQYGARLLSFIGELARPMIIVLDALETIPRDAEMHALMEQLLSHAPETVRFFLISRRVPRIRLQGLKMKRQVLNIENDELQFAPDEIKHYFKIFHDLQLGDGLAEKFHEITGGWTGGIVLISQALTRVPAQEQLRFLTDDLPNNLGRETLAYFAEEVFEGQNQKVKEFLIKTAILDVVDPDLAAHITGIDEARQILGELVEQNLFVQAVPDSVKGYCYRYNHLFREFLLSRFNRRIPKELQHDLYRQAGAVYAKRGDYSNAVACSLTAGDVDRAAAYVKKTGIDLFLGGRTHALKRWLNALPEEMIHSDPLLTLLLTLTRRVVGGTRNITDFKRALDGFEAVGNLRGLILSLAYLIEAGIFAGHDPPQMRQWVNRGEALLEKVADVPFYTYAKTILWLQIGFACISGGIGVHKGLSACRNASLLAAKMGHRPLAANAGIISALGLTLAGEFHRAEARLTELEPLMGRDGYPEYDVLKQLIGIELRLHKGELGNVEDAMARVRGDIEAFGLLFIYPAYVYTEGYLHIIKRSFEAARHSFRHLWDVATLAGNDYYRGLARRLEAMILYHQEQYLQARKAAEQAVGMLTETACDTIYLMRMQQMLGMIHFHQGALDPALDILREVLIFFREHNNWISRAECHIGLGLVADKQKDPITARSHLKIGFQIVSEYHYSRFIVLGPADVARACQLVHELEIDAAMPQAIRLQQAGSMDSADKQSSPVRITTVEKLDKPAPIQIVDPTALGGRLHIQTLGRFKVRLANGVTVAENGWLGTRPKLLLKALLVHGGREVPKDILTDMLWPDVAPEAAGRNFKITLHRLRKVLEPDLQRGRGTQFLGLKNKLLSLDRGLCCIDVDSFLQCCKDASRLENQSDPQRIIRIGQKAAEWYQGDFLPEEPYIVWAEMKRVALRNEYIRLMRRMVDACTGLGYLEKAAACMEAVLAQDPGHEQSLQLLMELYSRLGRRSEAVRAYEAFRQYLSVELGIEPDQKSKMLFRGL